MACDPDDSLVNPLNERVEPMQWMVRGRTVKNWNLGQGGIAQCTDENYAHVALFSDETFAPEGPSSFLMTVTATRQLDDARIGIVQRDYPETKNIILKADSDYGVFETTRNDIIGQNNDRSKFNMSVALNGRVDVNGNMRTQRGESGLTYRGGQFDIRIDIKDNQVTFRAPNLPGPWQDRRIVEEIRTSRDVRLAVMATQGFSFAIFEITSRFTLRDEMPRGIDMDLEMTELERLAKQRCKQVVKKVRAATATSPINIVVVGEYGSGKSSFINLLATLFSPSTSRPKSRALVTQNALDQGTRFVKAHTMRKTHLRLIDSIGIGMTEGDGGNEMNYDEGLLGDLLRGRINHGFSYENLMSDTIDLSGPRIKVQQRIAEMQESKEASTSDVAGYLAEGELDINEMNHGAFVMANCRNNAGSKIPFKQIKLFRSHNDGYPAVGVVTKLDMSVQNFNVKEMYHNADVSETFDAARKRLGFEAFPMRCYTPMENRQNILFNLLAAEALDALFVQAVEYKMSVADARGIEMEFPDVEDDSSDEDD